MLDANYIRHFKVLGKLCKLYDDATADVEPQQELLAAFVDQYADGVVDSLAAIRIFPQFTDRWSNAIANGPVGLQTIAQQAAIAYFQDPNFQGDLTTTPDSNSITDILTALQTEMGAGVDDKTLSTKDDTGLVNFFDSILESAGSPDGTWNTEADATADYKDSVYVVAAVI
jgi:hypothetical protein